MELKINVVIEDRAFRDKNSLSMRTTVLLNGTEYGSLKAIPMEAEPDYFDYIWDELGDTIREEYLKEIRKGF